MLSSDKGSPLYGQLMTILNKLMPHKDKIIEGSMVKRDQTGVNVLFKRYERKDGKHIISLSMENDDDLIPVIQFPSKVLASGKTKPTVEWKCPNMEHFQLFYSRSE